MKLLSCRVGSCLPQNCQPSSQTLSPNIKLRGSHTQLHQSVPSGTPSYLHSSLATCTVTHPNTFFELHRHSTVITLSFTHWLIFSTCNPLWIFFSFLFFSFFQLDRVRPILFDFFWIWDFLQISSDTDPLFIRSIFYQLYFLPNSK